MRGDDGIAKRVLGSCSTHEPSRTAGNTAVMAIDAANARHEGPACDGAPPTDASIRARKPCGAASGGSFSRTSRCSASSRRYSSASAGSARCGARSQARWPDRAHRPDRHAAEQLGLFRRRGGRHDAVLLISEISRPRGLLREGRRHRKSAAETQCGGKASGYDEIATRNCVHAPSPYVAECSLGFTARPAPTPSELGMRAVYSRLAPEFSDLSGQYVPRNSI